MPRIALRIRRVPHGPAAQIGYSLNTARLLANISLKTKTGWTAYEPGIVDTGATVSLFPADVWRDAEYRFIGSVRLTGVVAREECRVSARLARVSCALSDGLQMIGPLTIHACLADSDELPLLLGVADLIESGVLTVAIAQNTATFEH